MDIPHDLAERNQWVLWRNEQGRKIPYQPSGAYAKSNDPQTWSSLADCQAVANKYSGLGFVFAADDPFCGIDFDNVWQDGEVAEWASQILDRLDTYTEISPSGNGLKCWIRGEIPDGNGRRKTVTGNQQIEIYDRGRYFAYTGRSLDPDQLAVNDCQSGLDEILRQFWPAPSPSYSPPVNSSPGDVMERALRYLDRVPPAISGQDGHGQTIRVAAILVRGFALSEEQAYMAIQRWNATCQPPWCEKELRHKLADAAKHDGERGWLLNGSTYTGPDVELARLLASMEGDDEPIVNHDVRETDAKDIALADVLPVGFMREVFNYTIGTSKYPQPEIALAGAIAIMSVLTGRKVCDEMDTRTNTYTMTVNPARSGKDRPREVNKEILYQAGGQQHIGPERIGSSAGMVAWVHKEPAILFQIDELGRMLATCRDARKSPHLYNIATVMLSLYSSATNIWIADAYAETKKTKTIDQPHMVIFGTTTAETLWPNLSLDNVADGLMGRLLVFEGRGYVDFNETKKQKVPAEIIEAAKAWIEFRPGTAGNLDSFHPEPQIVCHSQKAKSAFLQHVHKINDCRKKENAFRAAVWSGTAEKTAKLALIHACSRHGVVPPAIDREDVEWGKRLSNWLTRRTLLRCSEELAENEIEARPKRVLKILGNERLTRRELTRRLQWMRRREREELLLDMEGCGLLATEEITTKGRPRTVYFRPVSGVKSSVNAI